VLEWHASSRGKLAYASNQMTRGEAWVDALHELVEHQSDDTRSRFPSCLLPVTSTARLLRLNPAACMLQPMVALLIPVCRCFHLLPPLIQLKVTLHSWLARLLLRTLLYSVHYCSSSPNCVYRVVLQGQRYSSINKLNSSVAAGMDIIRTRERGKELNNSEAQ
jgi:hypothetical protein